MMDKGRLTVDRAVKELVLANRILAREGVLDIFGHVSVRHPERPDRYFLACSRSPELVTADDVLEFDLDSNAIDDRGRTLYSERPIHGCIYSARQDVMSICHSHAHSLLPFSVTGNPIRPMFHVAAAIGPEVPIWEIRDEFGDATNLLVTGNDRGRSLARALGSRAACLMRGHGGVAASRNLRSTVYVAITLMQNAALLRESLKLGEVNYLSPGEVAELGERVLAPRALDRAWEYWCHRAECALPSTGKSVETESRGAAGAGVRL
jgi:ribulose-5-phosphate 4-epimerase/fuculose-1-phosphate aldolase